MKVGGMAEGACAAADWCAMLLLMHAMSVCAACSQGKSTLINQLIGEERTLAGE
jgi:hypothetical protein